MKTIIRFQFLVCILFLFLSNLLIAQTPYKSQSSPVAVNSIDNKAAANKSISIIPAYEDGTYTDNTTNSNSIKNFSASLVGNEVYVKLIIKGDTNKCIYALERSADGYNYEAVTFRNGIKLSDINTVVMYCFKDTNPGDRISYYRIKQILPNEENYSDAAIIYKKPEIEYVQKDF